MEPRDRRQEATGAREVRGEEEDGVEERREEDGEREEEEREEEDDSRPGAEARGGDRHEATEAFVMEAYLERGGVIRRVFAAAAVGASLMAAGCIAGETAPSPGRSAATVPLLESSSGYYGVYTSGNCFLFGRL